MEWVCVLRPVEQCIFLSSSQVMSHRPLSPLSPSSLGQTISLLTWVLRAALSSGNHACGWTKHRSLFLSFSLPLSSFHSYCIVFYLAACPLQTGWTLHRGRRGFLILLLSLWVVVLPRRKCEQKREYTSKTLFIHSKTQKRRLKFQ